MYICASYLHFFFAVEFVFAIAFSCVLTLTLDFAVAHISIEDTLRGIKDSLRGEENSWSGIKRGWSGIKGGKQSAGHEGSHGSGCSLSLDALGFHEERHLVTINIIFVMVMTIIIVITIPINTG